MRAKQLIASVAESREGVGPGDPVEVAHASSPVGEVEIRLDRRLGHRRCGLAGCQLPRSTACAAGSRSTGWLEAGACEGPPSDGASPLVVPLAGEKELRRRPRRRRNLRGGAVAPSAGGAPGAGAGVPLGATAGSRGDRPRGGPPPPPRRPPPRGPRSPPAPA